jgi:hypothetical protein
MQVKNFEDLEIWKDAWVLTRGMRTRRWPRFGSISVEGIKRCTMPIFKGTLIRYRMSGLRRV